jgi:TRAP-type C4-dicarboxylate transport system permease large subunit
MFGCVFDGLSLMVMTLPIVFPLLTGLGFDPIWVGVMITILIEIGQVTPPVGLNLSVLTAITNGEISLGRTAIATIPYWGILLLAIGIITLVPSVVLILPNAIF